MSLEVCFNGKVCLIEGDLLYVAEGRNIYQRSIYSENKQLLIRLPISWSKKLLALSKLSRRISRQSVTQILRVAPTEIAIFGFGFIFFFNERDKKITRIRGIFGKRPLVACAVDSQIYYGEYFGNPDRQNGCHRSQRSSRPPSRRPALLPLRSSAG